MICLLVYLPREIIRCTKLFKDLPLKIGDSVFPSDLIDFNLGDLNVILGMNWLGFYKAKIDYEAQKVVLRSLLGKLTSYQRFGKPKNFGIISAMQVKKLMKKGCELFSVVCKMWVKRLDWRSRMFQAWMSLWMYFRVRFWVCRLQKSWVHHRLSSWKCTYI